MTYELLAEGYGAAALQQQIESLEEAAPEGSLLELRLNFAVRFAGFDTAAITLNNALVNTYGVLPWPDEYQLVFPSPDAPFWLIRWKKGIVWSTYILIALGLVAVALLALALWQLLRLVREMLKDNPMLVYAIVGIGLLLVLKWNPKGG